MTGNPGITGMCAAHYGNRMILGQPFGDGQYADFNGASQNGRNGNLFRGDDEDPNQAHLLFGVVATIMYVFA